MTIDFPLIPPLDKESISAISALIGCIVIKKEQINLIPKSGVERWLVVILLFVPFFTVLTNQDPVFDGVIWISGLSIHDAISSFNIFIYPSIHWINTFHTWVTVNKKFR